MRRLCVLSVLGTLLALPPAAQATIVAGSFSGIIDGNVYDSYGLFGTAGGDLSGETLTANYSYDTSAAFSYMVQPTYDAYLGTGNLTLSVTIGGVTVRTNGVTDSQVIDTQDGLLTTISLSNLAPTPLLEFSLVVQGAWQPNVTINAPFALSPGTVRQAIYVSADGSHYDVLNFSGASVPAPGPLLLFGAGLLALALARRSQPTPRAAGHG